MKSWACLILSQTCFRKSSFKRQTCPTFPSLARLLHAQSFRIRSKQCTEIIRSIITILFPIFASYKALRTSDPAQLTPWLMYWVVLSCFSLIESWTWFILAW